MQNIKISFLIVALFFILFAGCSDKSTTVLRVGTNVWPGYEPLYLARALGFYDEKQVSLVELPNTTEVIRAYRNGIIDAAAVTMDEALLLAGYDLDFYIMLVFDFSNGADVLMARPPISSMEELAGKKVGYENTALGAYMLSRALDIAGVGMGEILPYFITVNDQEDAYKNGDVDLIVTFEPVRSKLLALGAREIFDSSQIPREIVDVLIVRKSFAEAHPQSVKKLLKGWFEALHRLGQEPLDSATIMTKRLGIGSDKVLASYETLLIPDLAQNRELLFDKKEHFLENIEMIKGVMLENKILDKDIDINSLLPTPNYRTLYFIGSL